MNEWMNRWSENGKCFLTVKCQLVNVEGKPKKRSPL